MANLLKVLQFKKTKKTPLAYEFQVDGASAPFLITNSKSLLWVDAPNNVVRAGVRLNCKVRDFFLEVLEEVMAVGKQAEWGNVHSFDDKGISLALSYLQDYDVGSVEVLVNPESLSSLGKLGVKVTVANWLPKEYAVFVPENRDFLGFVGCVGEDFVSVVHNPSRGLSIARTI